MNSTFSIVVPVYNSAAILPELYLQLAAALKDHRFELILVNDASADKSWEAILELCRKNKNVLGVSLRKNSGQDNAIMAGLRLARGEYVVIMDDDLQHDPKNIIDLHMQCAKGYDVCYGSFPQKIQKGWKNLGSWLNGKASEKLLSKPPEIYLSPFKIMRAEIIPELVKYTGPYPYIDALILSVTKNLTQITIPHHPRHSGDGNFNLKRSLSVFIKHATGYSVYPLRLAIIAGFLTSSLAFIMGLFFLVDYFRNDTKVEGWITIILVILMFGGIILVCLGLIGEYVGRIFLTINNKPQYTIERVVNYEPDQSLER